MNATDENTSRDTAAARAETGTAAWEDAVRLQRWATPDHADFYALACEIVATLHGLEDLARPLRRQVAGYGNGRAVYDDTRQHVPRHRLADATADLRSSPMRCCRPSARPTRSGPGSPTSASRTPRWAREYHDRAEALRVPCSSTLPNNCCRRYRRWRAAPDAHPDRECCSRWSAPARSGEAG